MSQRSNMTKFIFVTGGVVSSLGKGLTSAAIGWMLERRADSKAGRCWTRSHHALTAGRRPSPRNTWSESASRNRSSSTAQLTSASV